jgi:hypothetical protein
MAGQGPHMDHGVENQTAARVSSITDDVIEQPQAHGFKPPDCTGSLKYIRQVHDQHHWRSCLQTC